jgi:hypothetical protein
LGLVNQLLLLIADIPCIMTGGSRTAAMPSHLLLNSMKSLFTKPRSREALDDTWLGGFQCSRRRLTRAPLQGDGSRLRSYVSPLTIVVCVSRLRQGSFHWGKCVFVAVDIVSLLAENRMKRACQICRPSDFVRALLRHASKKNSNNVTTFSSTMSRNSNYRRKEMA